MAFISWTNSTQNYSTHLQHPISLPATQQEIPKQTCLQKNLPFLCWAHQEPSLLFISLITESSRLQRTANELFKKVASSLFQGKNLISQTKSHIALSTIRKGELPRPHDHNQFWLTFELAFRLPLPFCFGRASGDKAKTETTTLLWLPLNFLSWALEQHQGSTRKRFLSISWTPKRTPRTCDQNLFPRVTEHWAAFSFNCCR